LLRPSIQRIIGGEVIRLIHRRNLLKSVAAGAVSLGGLVAAPSSTSKAKTPRQFIESADGTNLFYRDWGAGSPVVFLAPWAMHSSWWEQQTIYLADRGLRCISYDRRGHGRSGLPGRGYDFDTLSSDLDALIEQLSLHDIMLVGHSMGCGEVVRYLTRHGSRRVARIALIATNTPLVLKTADNPDGAEKAVLEKARMDLTRDSPGVIARAAPSFFGASKNTVSQEMMQWWTRMMVDGCSLKVMIDLHRMFTETDFRPELTQIKTPTLLIHGDIDVSARLEMTGRKTAQLIPGSRLTIYENAAHGLPVTHADRLNADLLAFAKS
jgi:pimeloyl-ACP methyl ester carboxylesterase